jgi:hypothetical protein
MAHTECCEFSLPTMCREVLEGISSGSFVTNIAIVYAWEMAIYMPSDPLVQHDVVFPKTHDLLELHKLCLSVDPTFDLIGDLLDRLNPYSVEFRYPGEETTTEEAKAAVKAMKEVRRFVRRLLGQMG